MFPFSLTSWSPNLTSRLGSNTRSSRGYQPVPVHDSNGADGSVVTVASTIFPDNPLCAHCWQTSASGDKTQPQCAHCLIRLLVLLPFATMVLTLLSIIVIGSVIVIRNRGGGISTQYEMEVYGYTLQSAEAECLTNPQSSIIVSLTSVPERLPYVHRTLKTLLMQTHCPRAILLWLPRISIRLHSAYIIPPDLEAFNSTSLILSIRWSDEDLGPATKLLPTIVLLNQQGQDDQRVVIVDDDMLYSRRLLAYYECYSGLYPDAALGHWGCPASQGQCRWGSDLQHPVPVDILFGTASYLIKPSFFDIGGILRYDFTTLVPEYSDSERHMLQSAAFYEDDVWVSLNLFLTSHLSLVIPIDHSRFAPTDTIFFYRGALFHGINADHRNYDLVSAVLVVLTNGPKSVRR